MHLWIITLYYKCIWVIKNVFMKNSFWTGNFDFPRVVAALVNTDASCLQYVNGRIAWVGEFLLCVTLRAEI